MFEAEVKEFRAVQRRRADVTADAAAKSRAATAKLAPAIVRSQSALADLVGSRQKEIAASAKALEKNSDKFSKEVNQWKALLSGYEDVIFGMGDAQHLMAVVERDARAIITGLQSLAAAHPADAE
eukprot:gnl/Chilomastix_cuspidata/517.p3 GENE.gnl/Chilomastix_cuspidata/517~~gnl/Chilomastix_cuspidata/517.p3  ORF type:complete len:125 (+),score=59.22 gnl/Chilomastix_cuspidata/517:797-1171(+)